MCLRMTHLLLQSFMKVSHFNKFTVFQGNNFEGENQSILRPTEIKLFGVL